MKSKSEYLQKLVRKMSEYLDKIDNSKMLELVARYRISTIFFLNFCANNDDIILRNHLNKNYIRKFFQK